MRRKTDSHNQKDRLIQVAKKLPIISFCQLLTPGHENKINKEFFAERITLFTNFRSLEKSPLIKRQFDSG